MKGTVYLIPIPIAEDQPVDKDIAQSVLNTIQYVDVFFVENLKTARRYLRKIDRAYPIDDKVFHVLDKRSSDEDISRLVKVHQDQTLGVISEAGCPGIADPGELVVKYAHQNSMKITPLVGPSSILLALIASGKNGQNFTFNGYLPKERGERIKKIKKLEQLSRGGVTQIFMETPFRNNNLLEDVLKEVDNGMTLCIACNINTQTEFIRTKKIGDWKINSPDIHKKPTIFVL